MKRTLLLFSFLTFFMVGVMNVQASNVESYHHHVNQIIDKANEKIDKKIDIAVKKGNKILNQYNHKIEKGNQDYNIISDYYNTKLDKIIDELLADTKEIVNDTQLKLDRYGVIIVCYEIEVLIGDRTVLVDPIRVHTW